MRAGFTEKYDVTKLVWYEVHDLRETAFQARAADEEMEPDLKIEPIEGMNPGCMIYTSG